VKDGRVGAILVAAGRSTRMGFDKLRAPLGDRPVLAWSLAALTASPAVERVVLVVAPDRHVGAGDGSQHRNADADDLLAHVDAHATIAIIVGGERRRDSVAAGLVALDGYDWAVVHDGARPFLTECLIHAGLEAARVTGAAIAAVPVRDTIKQVRGEAVIATLPRSELWAVQTPQVFRADLLRQALDSTDEDVTDEAALVERIGGTVRVYRGDERNLKITTPADLDLARALIALGEPSAPT
jgi:2-C-methyl-D-erythritol 4-phosphate cytidylyltransferase